jgi:hypothetical protein
MNTDGENVLGVGLRAGAAAAVVAALLVAWVIVTGNSADNFATDALIGPSTTLMPSTTVGSDVIEIQASGQVQAPSWTRSEIHEGLEDVRSPGDRDPDGPAGDDTAITQPTAASPSAVRIPRPSCAAGLGAASQRTAPFTGQSASIPSNMPAVIVKVSNNNSKSRAALIGIDQADIVFEERIEASATRFAAVFHSSLPANVGPVRSGRTTDIQITQNLNRPVMGYSGSNAGVAAQIKFAADNELLVPYVNTDSAPFARDGRYSAPDNLFVDPASLGACGGGGSPTSIFTYGAASSTTAQPASSVSLQARSPYRFDWNGSGWTRSQDGYAHATRTGAPISPTNVVVLFVPYVQSVIDSASVDAQTIGSGNARIFRDGTVTQGSWNRAKGHEPYTLTDGNGTATTLAPGQTWVVLAPAGTASWN